jgi:hypothetical protein
MELAVAWDSVATTAATTAGAGTEGTGEITAWAAATALLDALSGAGSAIGAGIPDLRLAITSNHKLANRAKHSKAYASKLDAPCVPASA